MVFLLEWKIDWADGQLDEWLRTDVEEFLLEWCPRKLSVAADTAREMAASVADAFAFLGEEGLLSSSSDSAQILAAHARSIGPEFSRKMSDPANFGMAKSILSGVGADFGEEMTQEKLDELMRQFIALPYEQRAAITDPAIGSTGPKSQVVGPVVLPTEPEVRESAASAPVLARLAALNKYFEAPGRPVTAKGNIKLADAQDLSGLIGSEPLEAKWGRHTHRRHSSATMPDLDHWQWWARQAGVLRVNRGRLVGVKAWRLRLEKDPVGEATKAFEILMDYGVVGSYARYRLWSSSELIDGLAGYLLALPLASTVPVEFDSIVDAVLRYREETGMRPIFDNDELQADMVRGDVDRMLTMLERAGVVTQQDRTLERTTCSTRRTGGTVELTAFGVMMAIQEVESAGLSVETMKPPAELSAHDLASLAVGQLVDVDSWLDVLVSWIGQKENRSGALKDLFDALDDSTLLTVLGLTTPDDLVDDFAEVLQTAFDAGPADDALAALASGWLANQDRLDPSEVSPETVNLSRLTVLGLLALTDPASVPGLMGLDRSREEMLGDVSEAARMMPPNVEVLLDAIGRHHPDKVVAKSGRRELLRVRSRLINRPRG